MSRIVERLLETGQAWSAASPALGQRGQARVPGRTQGPPRRQRHRQATGDGGPPVARPARPGGGRPGGSQGARWPRQGRLRLSLRAFGGVVARASGGTEDEVCIGDRWFWGDAVLEVCQPGAPCFELAMHRRRGDIGRLLRESGRCGWYLRVLERAWQLWADPWQLEAAARLLTTTALPIAQIASRRGFRSAELLRQAFVERYATTPSRHRGAAAVERRGPSGRTPG